MRSVSFLRAPSLRRIVLLVYFILLTPFRTKCVGILFMGSFRTGGLFSLSSSALLPHLEQSAFCFLLQDPFQQEDCFTCLVQHLNTIWSRERCDSFLRVPSHRRIFLLLYFCSSTPFETKCILILIPGSLPTGRLFHLSSSKSVLILF